MIYKLKVDFDNADKMPVKQTEIYNRALNNLNSLRKAVFAMGGIFGPDTAEVFGRFYGFYPEAEVISDLYEKWLIGEDGEGNENDLFESEVIKLMIESGTKAFMDELQKTIEYMEKRVVD